jgi:hypothetical protein
MTGINSKSIMKNTRIGGNSKRGAAHMKESFLTSWWVVFLNRAREVRAMFERQVAPVPIPIRVRRDEH